MKWSILELAVINCKMVSLSNKVAVKNSTLKKIKEVCRTLRKGSVDFSKAQNVSKVSKKR